MRKARAALRYESRPRTPAKGASHITISSGVTRSVWSHSGFEAFPQALLQIEVLALREWCPVTGSLSLAIGPTGKESYAIVVDEHQTIQQRRAVDGDELRDTAAHIVGPTSAPSLPADCLEQRSDQPCLRSDAEIGVGGLVLIARIRGDRSPSPSQPRAVDE